LRFMSCAFHSISLPFPCGIGWPHNTSMVCLEERGLVSMSQG
jgi:hypothetical protein